MQNRPGKYIVVEKRDARHRDGEDKVEKGKSREKAGKGESREKGGKGMIIDKARRQGHDI